MGRCLTSIQVSASSAPLNQQLPDFADKLAQNHRVGKKTTTENTSAAGMARRIKKAGEYQL